MSPEPQLRLGTTSYIIPADIVPNVRFLAGQVQDVELVLFEVDDGPNNLPGPQDIAELRSLAEANGMSYTVHLPLDLRLASGSGEQHVSLFKARKVIDCTRDLQPWAYVLHLDGHEFIDNPGAPAWRAGRSKPSGRSSWWPPGPDRPNCWPWRTWTATRPSSGRPCWQQVPVSRCIDIGHLWKDGFDPLPFLERHLARARVLHIHGIGTRDHQSLAHQTPDQLDAVFSLLVRRKFSGVVTLEVFGEDDFHSSIEVIRSFWTFFSQHRQSRLSRRLGRALNPSIPLRHASETQHPEMRLGLPINP